MFYSVFYSLLQCNLLKDDSPVRLHLMLLYYTVTQWYQKKKKWKLQTLQNAKSIEYMTYISIDKGKCWFGKACVNNVSNFRMSFLGCLRIFQCCFSHLVFIPLVIFSLVNLSYKLITSLQIHSVQVFSYKQLTPDIDVLTALLHVTLQDLLIDICLYLLFTVLPHFTKPYRWREYHLLLKVV